MSPPPGTSRRGTSRTNPAGNHTYSNEVYTLAPLRFPSGNEPTVIPKLPPPTELLALPPLTVEQTQQRLRLPVICDNLDEWRVQLPKPPIMIQEMRWQALLHEALQKAAMSAGSVLTDANMDTIAKLVLQKLGLPQTSPRDADVRAAEEAAMEHVRMGLNADNAQLIAHLARLIRDIRDLAVSQCYTKD